MTTVVWESKTLRIIIDPPLAPQETMDRDCAILADLPDDSPVIVRFYRWAAPAISLGRLEPITAIDHEQANRHGVAVVRRPSGGRHLFHTNDCSFSIFIPQSAYSIWGNSVPARQELLGSLLNQLIQRFGISVDQTKPQSVSAETVRSFQHRSCFSFAAPHEPQLAGKKIAGCAQLVTGTATLIQGTIPLSNEYLNITDYEPISVEEQADRRRELESVSCSADQWGGRSIGGEEIVDQFCAVLIDWDRLEIGRYHNE